MNDIHFNVNEPITAKLEAGLYDVFLVGGFHFEANKGFGLRIGNATREIPVIENYLKMRCFKNWRRAIRYFNFRIDEIGEYHISTKNAQDLQIRRSRLLMHRLFTNPLPMDKVELIISPR